MRVSKRLGLKPAWYSLKQIGALMFPGAKLCRNFHLHQPVTEPYEHGQRGIGCV